MPQFQKKFGQEGAGELATSLTKALRAGFEAGNPGGDGSLVEVPIDAGTGSTTVEGRAQYAMVANWSALPATPGIAFSLSGGTLSVLTDSGFSGSVFFWVHG